VAKRRVWMGQLKSKVEDRIRTGMNQVLEGVNRFEAQGGVRGACERAKVRGERQAARLLELLDEKGIRVDFSAFGPVGHEKEQELRRHYRVLGVPYGADYETTRHAYRAQMREHHPDRHAGDPEAERLATRKSQDLTLAFDAIERYLKPR